MELPFETQQLVKNFLEKLRVDTWHHFKAVDRFAIYKSIGYSRIFHPTYSGPEPDFVLYLKNEIDHWTIADYTLSWLAIITVQKVLPIWEEVCQNINYPKDMPSPYDLLNVAEDILMSKANIEEVNEDISNKFNGPVFMWTTFQGNLVYQAALYALESILYEDIKYLENANSDDIDGVRDVLGDFTSIAMQAYSFLPHLENINQNKPSWPIKLNPQKRLEFWEWWLTEAIPQAWELAQTSYQDREKNQE